MSFYTVYNTLKLQILIFSIFYSVSKNSYIMTTIIIANPQLYQDRKYLPDGRMWAGYGSWRSNRIHPVPTYVPLRVSTCIYVSLRVSTCIYVSLRVSTWLYVSVLVCICIIAHYIHIFKATINFAKWKHVKNKNRT